jgi:hypothetical protein
MSSDLIGDKTLENGKVVFIEYEMKEEQGMGKLSFHVSVGDSDNYIPEKTMEFTKKELMALREILDTPRMRSYLK